MKKMIGALVVGGMVFSAAMVSASSLTVGGGTIQAGTLTNLSCQQGQVSVGYTTQINGQGQDEVTGVTLHGIEGACYGKWADISLMPAGPFTGGVPWIASAWGTIGTSPDQTFALQGSHPNAVDVGQVSVAIRDN